MDWINIISPALTAILAVITLWGHISSPVHKNRKRLDLIEKRLDVIEIGCDERRKHEQSQIELNVMILKTLSTFCKHELDGNHTAGLRECAEEIDSLVFRKGGSV